MICEFHKNYCCLYMTLYESRQHAFRNLQIQERKWRRVRVLSARGLVLCFRARLGALVMCNSRLKTTSFAFFSRACFFLFFTMFSRKKSCCDRNNAVWMTQLTKKTSEWFLISWKYKTHLSESPSRQNFVVNEPPTRSFPIALLVKDNYVCTLWTSEKTRTRLCSRSTI